MNEGLVRPPPVSPCILVNLFVYQSICSMYIVRGARLPCFPSIPSSRSPRLHCRVLRAASSNFSVPHWVDRIPFLVQAVLPSLSYSFSLPGIISLAPYLGLGQENAHTTLGFPLGFPALPNHPRPTFFPPCSWFAPGPNTDTARALSDLLCMGIPCNAPPPPALPLRSFSHFYTTYISVCSRL